MSDSIREQILANIEDTLKGVQIENGYEVDLRTVRRTPRHPLTEPLLPAAFVTDTGEEKEEGSPTQHTHCTLHVAIVFYNEEYEDMSQKAIQIQASIEKALSVDPQRGGLAYDTDIKGNEFAVDEEHFPIGGGVVRCDVSYRHKLGDPYTL